MADLPCPSCGRPSGGVCPECYVKKHPFRVKPDSYRVCECGLMFFKGKWYDDRMKLFHDVAEKSIHPPEGVRVRRLRVRAEEKAGSMLFDVEVKASYKRVPFEDRLHWEVRPERTVCEECRRLGSGYYEAVMQVRDMGLRPEWDRRKLAKLEKVRGGYDAYLTSLEYARTMVSDFISRGYLVKESSKLFGKRNGRDVYRHYFSVKHPSFGEGDFIRFKGRPFRVSELGRTVKLLDIESGKVKSASLHQLEDSEVLAGASGVRSALVTEIRPDGMQLLDQKSFETRQAPLKEGLSQGDEVEYLLLDGRVYVL